MSVVKVLYLAVKNLQVKQFFYILQFWKQHVENTYLIKSTIYYKLGTEYISVRDLSLSIIGIYRLYG